MIWENPNPNQGFEAQTITFKSTNFIRYELFYKAYTGFNTIDSISSLKGYCPNNLVHFAGNSWCVREIEPNTPENSIKFKDCVCSWSSGAPNTYLVPLKIIGYKY